MTEKDLEIQELRRQLRGALEDIPHVGRYCKSMNERGRCAHNGQICCKQVNTACGQWEWRGVRE